MEMSLQSIDYNLLYRKRHCLLPSDKSKQVAVRLRTLSTISPLLSDSCDIIACLQNRWLSEAERGVGGLLSRVRALRPAEPPVYDMCFVIFPV